MRPRRAGKCCVLNSFLQARSAAANRSPTRLFFNRKQIKADATLKWFPQRVNLRCSGRQNTPSS